MMNKILCVIGLLLLGLFVMGSRFHDRGNRLKCDSVQVTVKLVGGKTLITEREVLGILSGARSNPTGKALKSVNTEQMEESLRKSGFVKRAECYKTTGGDVKVYIEQPRPFFRVFSTEGSFYIGDNRERIPLSLHYADYLPVVTGAPSNELLQGELFDFVDYISSSSFWNAQIEQICVERTGEVTLIPRVGDQEILLGKLTHYKTKLDNLLAFYQQGMGKAGWGKYKTINVKFENQVVCTKR